MPTRLAIIGGSGLYQLDGFVAAKQLSRETPFGQTSAEIQVGSWQGFEVLFFPRHGRQHQVPPHKINYRANIWALKQAQVSGIIAVNAVGGINSEMGPESIVVPDQIIDYSWGREHTFSDGTTDAVQHVDFTYPFSQTLREQLIDCAKETGIDIVEQAVYGCTNGPRLESAAEIRRLANDGCDLVGMTAMPEAALARELEIDYATLAVVVNTAAGLNAGEIITMEEIMTHLENGLQRISLLLQVSVRQLNQ